MGFDPYRHHYLMFKFKSILIKLIRFNLNSNSGGDPRAWLLATTHPLSSTRTSTETHSALPGINIINNHDHGRGHDGEVDI